MQILSVVLYDWHVKSQPHLGHGNHLCLDNAVPFKVGETEGDA